MENRCMFQFSGGLNIGMTYALTSVKQKNKKIILSSAAHPKHWFQSFDHQWENGSKYSSPNNTSLSQTA